MSSENKPDCFGYNTEKLKCFNCPVNFQCLKQKERELALKEWQKDNLDSLIDYIKHYNQLNTKKKKSEIKFTMRKAE